MLKLTSLYAITLGPSRKWNLNGYAKPYRFQTDIAHANEGCLSEVFSSAILFRLTQSPGIKKLLLLMLFMLSVIFFTKAQVTVTGAHTSSNGTYTTVKDAFDAINAQTQTGNTIVLTVTAGTTETASAVLNAGAWTSLTMYPTTSGLTISGTLAGAPVIDLNGADNVTVDGRVNATGTTVDLVITNTSTSATAGTSTIRFINDACSNTVQYCLIEGSSTDASAGIIFFSTASAGGNDNNSISNNNITADVDANRPLNAIFSLGSASNDNNGNSISNNNIYNFFSRSGASSQGILLSSNTTAWVINGNSFYETASFTPIATTPYSVIYINNASGISFRINDNFIGGRAASCGGLAWTKTSSSGVQNNPFYAIRCNVGSSDSSRIYNNRIQNWSWVNSAASAWYGIAVEAGQVNIGNSGGNWIGDTTGTGNITYTAGQSSNAVGNFYGIHISGANNVSIRNNLMGSITTANGNSGWSTSFYGINKTAAAGTLTIVNNTIGSRATANSIRCSSTSTGFIQNDATQVLYGVYSLGTGVHTVDANTISRLTNSTTNTSTSFQGVVRGVHISGHASGSTITNNIVQHLTIANANTSSTGGGVVGIFASNSSTTCTISGNLIHTIFNSNVDFTGQVCAIYFWGLNNQNSNIRNNFIYNIYTASINGTPSVFGINCFRSDVIVSNNIISLSSNSRAHFYGIRTDNESFSSDGSILFNTVYLSGTQSVASTINSRCIWLSGSSGSSTAHYVNNNILHNIRTNSGSATGVHAAVHFDFSTNAFCNYNNYFVNGTGGVVGYWPSSNRTTLADLQTANGQDAGSTNVNVVFTNAGGTTAGSYLPTSAAANLVLMANRTTSITTDYTGATRTFYSMGAYDFAVNQPLVQVTATVGTAAADYSSLKLALDAVNAGTHRGVVEVKIATSLSDNQTATLYQSGYNGTSSYTSLAIYPTSANLVYEVSLAGALLDLNGADNVSIDGRVNRAGSAVALTFSNTSTSSSANTLRFINGAQSNTIRYISLKGGSTGGSTGLINFSTSTSGTNSSNIIEYCSISGLNSTSRPRHAIYSLGSASPNGNDNNTIRFNEISHFFIEDGLGGDVTAVGVYSNSSAWTITDNSFFLPSTISLFNGTYHVIYINNTSGVNFQVNNNFIGGTSANCGGGTFTITSGRNFYGIRMNVGTSIVSNIQGNTFRKISHSNSSAFNFILIEASSGNINIGTTTGNALGDSTTTGSIVFNRAASTANNFYGINILSEGTINCQNNIISGINIGPVNNNSAANFVGIRNTPGGFGYNTATISNNIIGSYGVSNSINISTTSETAGQVQSMDGILSTSGISATINDNLISNLNNATNNPNTTDAGRINGIRCTGGTQTMLRNTVRNLSIANSSVATDQTASVGGIVISGAGAHTLTSNIVTGLSNSNSSFSGTIHGLYLVGTSSLSNITRNFIQGLAATGASSSSATLYGIRHISGQATYTNNIVAFGNNNPGTFYGIFDAGAASSATNIYNNSVSLSGSPTTGALNSFAFYSNAANSARNIRNNVFANARSNSGATGTHYAAFFNYAVSTSLTLDYNNYFAGGSGGVIGRYNSANVSTVPIIATFDANSTNLNPSFSLSGGVRPTDYKTSQRGLVGIPISGITTDFANTTRTTYSMGAYDQPVFSVWTGAVSTVWSATGNWSTGVVPPVSPEIQFSPSASRNLVLDANRSVKAIYFNGSSRSIELGNFNLTIDSIITGGTASSYVQTNGTGIVTKTISNAASFNFQVGNAAYNPVSITNNTGASDAFSLRVLNEVYYRGTAGNVAKEPRVARTWLIDKVNPNGGSGVDFQFNWNSGEMTTGVNTPRMYHYNGNIWDKQTGSTSSTSTSLTYTGYTGTFSPFTIGDDLSILPVTWLHLNCARKSSNAVMLNWATAEEKDASHFEIQRMTDTGYRSIGRVTAVGNSLSPTHYRFVDASAPEIASLYRVLQKDANGDFSFSPGCMASASAYSAENRLFNVTPVPADGELNVFTPFNGEEIEYSLINAAGMNALNGKFMKANIQINTSGLNNGLYLLRVKTAEGIRQIRVVISHH